MRLPARTLALLAALAPGLAGAEEAGGATAVPAPAESEPAAPPAGPPSSPPVVPAQAVVEKLGRGDRLFLSGDHRNALFAYQDAVYMQPGYAPAHARLGRAYLALRYPARAIAQAEAALAADPESAEARKLLAEARLAWARAAGPDPAPPAGSRVFRLAPPEDGAAAQRGPASADAPPQPR
jgi:tetratricopeptide (TPR) repeat protein